MRRAGLSVARRCWLPLHFGAVVAFAQQTQADSYDSVDDESLCDFVGEGWKLCAIFDCISALRWRALLYPGQPQEHTPGEHTARPAIPRPRGLCPLVFASSTSALAVLSTLGACRLLYCTEAWRRIA
jgi:hypothetical protein